MAIRSSLYFIYDGIQSTQFNIMNVSVQSGLYEEPFAPTRSILEKSVRGRFSPYYQDVQYAPLKFTVSFAFQDSWNDTIISDVARWLCTPNYFKPLIFSDDPDKIYYAIVVDDINLVHNGMSQGYLQLQFRCDSAFAYSPVYTSDMYDLSSNQVEGATIQLANRGSVDLKPEISITKVGSGDISIMNLSDGGKTFTITGLNDNEDLYIDCENEYIETSLSNIYRQGNITGDYLSLPYGINNLVIKGNCKLQFRYRYKRIQ